jgi:hypothetical protein
LLALTDDSLFEFLFGLEKTADRFPPHRYHVRRPGPACKLDGAGTGGVPLAGNAWMISACRVLDDAVRDLLLGLLLPVFLD